MIAALRSVPALPELNRDIEKTVAKRRERANQRLNDAAGDPIATMRALVDNLTSALGLLNLTEQGEVLARIAPTLTNATSTAYRAALARKRGTQ